MPISRRSILGAALAAIPVVGLAACSSNSGGSGSSGSGGSGPITVGFSQVGAESGWRTANTESIKASLTEANGFKLTFVDAQQKQENQIKALRDFIAQGMDVIAFSPVIQTGWDQVLQEIKDAKIPLVLTDRAVTSSLSDPYQGFIGSDFKKEGTAAGDWVKKNAPDAKIFELQGTMGSAPQVDRQSGFEAVVGSQVIGRASGNFTRAEGKTAMEAALQSYPDMTLLFAHNDDMGLGALEAITAAGKTPGTDIKIVTVDAVKDGLKALYDKKFNYVVECNPVFGDQLADLIKKVHAGQSSTTQTIVTETTFDQSITQATIDARKY
ncbi:ABC transporter substrate-binding protein [Raineyella sp. W15-4]|uniref:ABC transporter substrate-binding protein n=1 Tax=Raineyella sp. W15-4 TaxID=3081651 RepID=UPI002952E8F2|nr:ABC transporter substrate-binding protein [Raineyella sp. W15-4]WOQ15722.1 ABC transporter substrate-binding protein [Raineyella sp. W15-4]